MRSGKIISAARLALAFSTVFPLWPALSAQSLFQTQQSAVDCSDPAQQSSALCQNAAVQTPHPGAAAAQQDPMQTGEQDAGRSVYVDSGGFSGNRSTTDRQRPTYPLKLDLPTDFQRLVRDAINENLRIFGRDLFRTPPSTFAPADQVPVTPDYVLGPGDEIVVRTWGHSSFNGRLTVDRTGAIYIPQVGSIHVAGEHFTDLQPQLQRELGRVYRNFGLAVNLGQLRSIQVFVLGEAQHPGAYTVSALSTAFNALLVSGGPTPQGSLRQIEIRRAGQLLTKLDLYDFALRGDKSKDVSLQSGDVIFIPVAGPQVALGGSVRRPAIYELLPGNTLQDLLSVSGGFSSTASSARISIERIDGHRDRQSMNVALDAAGLATPLEDGDVLRAASVLASFRDSVTIRGNLANAGRFPFRAGMKLSDIIPDRESLFSNDYWRRRNRLGLPTPLFTPLTPNPQPYATSPANFSTQTNQAATDPNATSSATTATSNADTAMALSPDEEIAAARLASRSTSENAGLQISRGTLADQQTSTQSNRDDLSRRNQIKSPSPEIDWSYAVIERLDPGTLRTSLVPFNLGKLVMNQDATQDLPLQPGDIVTILSQSDIRVSQDEQTKFIRLEGEFVSSGVYSVAPDETLADIVRKAGGLTTKAYLFGSSYTRESARAVQQQRLDEYISDLSVQLNRSAATRALSSTTGALSTGSLETERELISQLRQMRATGRIVLEFNPKSTGQSSVPAIGVEDGDTFRVPSRPNIISVVGAVYGQNVFLFNDTRRVSDYLKLAGRPNRVADKSHAFIIRADGSIFSRQTASGLWSDHFNSALLNPGDTIVMPEKPIRPSILRDFLDYSQVFSQFGIAAATISVLR